MSERGQLLMHVPEAVRRDGAQSSCEEVGVRWETGREKEVYTDIGTDGFSHVVEKQVEGLFVSPVC